MAEETQKPAKTCGSALSKREEFAKAALAGLCTKEINSVERVAERAVEIADATLAALKRK